MAENDQQQANPAGLRRRAEALWRKQAADRCNSAPPGTDIPFEEALNLFHELEVHQIELEMQNEELRRAQEELSTSRARYFDLYDLAPVGYLTLNEDGLILEGNLTAADLLGLERSQLVKQPLFRFIVPADQDIYYLHRRRLSASLQPQVCELRMLRGGPVPPAAPAVHAPSGPGRPQAKPEQKDNGPLWVRLQATVTQTGTDAPVWRVTLSDITARKQTEDALQLAHDDLELRVEERTAELRAVNEALRQSRDQLQSLTHRLVEVQEDERRAIARELHDGAGQALTVMMLDLGALARDMNGGPKTAARIRQLQTATDGLMSELHALAANLHPAILDRLGLVPALRQHVINAQNAEGPQIQIETVGLDTQRLPPQVELAVYRVAQEAVNNAIRHGHASHIGLLLQRQASDLVVTIEDDGCGFNAEAPAEGGLGLLSMRERIEMLGGSLTIESAPGAGTTVYAYVPLEGLNHASRHSVIS